MTDPFDDFARAWEAGELPEPDTYLDRVPAAERPDLSARIRAYLAVAPEPEWPDAALEELAADPAAARALEIPLDEPEAWPSLLPRLRARAGVTWSDVARGLGVARPERARDYLEAMERGEHEPRRVTARALAAIARALDVPADALGWLGPPSAPVLLRAAAAAPAPALDRLEVVADLATRDADDFDDVDLLFLGGRDIA